MELHCLGSKLAFVGLGPVAQLLPASVSSFIVGSFILQLCTEHLLWARHCPTLQVTAMNQTQIPALAGQADSKDEEIKYPLWQMVVNAVCVRGESIASLD